MEAHGKDRCQIIEDHVTEKHLPPGKPISTNLTPSLLGDVLQTWNFLSRFVEVLGLSKSFSFEELTTELDRPFSDGLFEAHVSMLQVLLREFHMKVKEHCKKKLRKPSMLQVLLCEFHMKVIEHCKEEFTKLPPVNDLTWLEVAGRYILAVLFMSGDPDSAKVHKDMDLFRCLHGDGGPRFGVLTGVVGLETDTRLYAAAAKDIYGSLDDGSDKLAAVDFNSKEGNTSQVNEGTPDWVRDLEPIENMKTNNGSKIRNCIRSSLAKGPPEYFRKMLEESISEKIYKGNASGPTKNLARRVIREFHQQNIAIRENRKKFVSLSDIVMKRCRFVLRQAAKKKNTKRFRDLLGQKLLECGNDKEWILRSPLSPLYYRMIDMRLATGAYCGSHEAFVEDLREFWRNVQIAFGDDSKLVQLAKKSCEEFESLYNTEVVAVHEKLKSGSPYNDSENDILPEAPWDVVVCKVCGTDQNDKNEVVLICDGCNKEYHTYCLSPPVAKVPDGNWFCPRCAPDKDYVNDASPSVTASVCQQELEYTREFQNFLYNTTADLAAMILQRDYWELNLHQRTLLLKFLCDEMLDSAPIQEHLTNCESSIEEHLEEHRVKLRALKKKARFLSKKTRIGVSSSVGVPEVQGDPSDIIDNNLDGAKSEGASNMMELSSVTNDLLLLKNSIAGLEADARRFSLGSEFLGVDSSCRLYWIIYSDAHPWIIVNGMGEHHHYSMSSQDAELQRLVKTSILSGGEHLLSTSGSEAYNSWACYQSDAEIQSIMDYLKDEEPLRRRLEKCVSLHYKPRPQVLEDSKKQGEKEHGENPMVLKCLMTKALELLQSRHGVSLELEKVDSLKNQNKGKGVAEGKMYRCECLEPILPARHHCFSCHRSFFTTKEFKSHGGQNCNFKSMGFSIFQKGEGTSKFVAGQDFSKDKGKAACSEDGCSAPNIEGMELDGKKLEIDKFYKVPESSVRQLTGKAYDVLTQLKSNLLDMEAALSKDAVRSSKACTNRRCAWREFVKCAITIYEMVQAMIVLEDMIKLEYLDSSWRYWSSISAAASISTLAALSWRIYSLDAAIRYENRCTLGSFKLWGGIHNVKKRKKEH